MTPQAVIRRKRDGRELAPGELAEFVDGVVAGRWSPGQAGAMLMAIFLQGLSASETSVLLERMLHSGDVLDLAGVPRPVVDKHSTGGVGDKVSLILAPLAASCGLSVPMLSGRGLGHTGGTLDKLESIPGFTVSLSTKAIRRQVKEIGCVMAGQTDSLVPADKILYALRDETATVENASLIAASILSKKLAEDLDALLLDVKVGRGAFFEDPAEAEHLARLMVDLGKAAGCRVAAWLTDMNNPLGAAVGNAVEVAESITILRGEGSDQLADLVCRQVAGLLELSGRADSFEEALTEVRQRLADGSALERFRAMIAAQGGNPAVVDDPSLLPQSSRVIDLLYEEPDPVWVSGVDARAIAEVVLETGAGRRCAGDPVDHSTGISGLVGVGDRLEPGDLVCRLHHSDPGREAEWVKRIHEAVSFSPESVQPGPLILKQIS